MKIHQMMGDIRRAETEDLTNWQRIEESREVLEIRTKAEVEANKMTKESKYRKMKLWIALTTAKTTAAEGLLEEERRAVLKATKKIYKGLLDMTEIGENATNELRLELWSEVYGTLEGFSPN